MQLTRRVGTGFAVGFLALAASALHDAPPPGSQAQDALGRGGLGAGTITMPTLESEGLLVGVFVEDKRGTRYMLEAKLTSFMPLLFDPHNRVVMGGVYGHLLEVPGAGMSSDVEPEFAGRVEGLWRMEKNLTGEFRALVFRRSDVGAQVIAGTIDGDFRVAVVDDPVPGPHRPDWILRDPVSDTDKSPAGETGQAWRRKPKQPAGSFGADTASGIVLPLVQPPLASDAASAGRSKSSSGDASNVYEVRSQVTLADSQGAAAQDKKQSQVADAHDSGLKGGLVGQAASNDTSDAGGSSAQLRKNPSASKGGKKARLVGLASSQGFSNGTSLASDSTGLSKAPDIEVQTAAGAAAHEIPLMMGEFRARFRLLD